jgi:hypothetical protein
LASPRTLLPRSLPQTAIEVYSSRSWGFRELLGFRICRTSSFSSEFFGKLEGVHGVFVGLLA